MSSLLPTKEERREFLEERRSGVGGSDVAAIVGLNPYKGPMDVYLDKVRGPSEEEVENIHLLRGQLLEDTFATLYAEQSGRDVRRMGQREHPDLPWAQVNVDRQILDDGHGKGTGALEVKSPGRESFQRLIEEGLPERYLVQLQWELFVPGYQWGSFAAGNLEHSGGPLIYFDVERNDLLIEELVNRVEVFWHQHVERRVPPDPDEWEEEPPQVPDTTGDRVVVEDPEIRAAVVDLMDAYEARKAAKEAYKQEKKKMQAVLEEAGVERIQVPGQGKVNYIWQEGRTRLDKDRLKRYSPLDPDAAYNILVDTLGEDEGAAIAERLMTEAELDFSMFEKEGSPYRRFTPYPASDREEADDE